jgi:hypothetical protein
VGQWRWSSCIRPSLQEKNVFTSCKLPKIRVTSLVHKEKIRYLTAKRDLGALTDQRDVQGQHQQQEDC